MNVLVQELLRNVSERWLAAQQRAPYFQTSGSQLADFGYTNCTTAGEFAEHHGNFGGPVCYNGTIPWLA
eukprot:COSAG01_NODE_615_length_14818_cov_9.454039_13_plen_69_part_00